MQWCSHDQVVKAVIVEVDPTKGFSKSLTKLFPVQLEAALSKVDLAVDTISEVGVGLEAVGAEVDAASEVA
jgi:hypothetical protein